MAEAASVRGAPESLRVLAVQDSPADAGPLREALAQTGAHLDLEFTQTLADAQQRVRHGRYDCVLLDPSLSHAAGVDGVESLRAARRGQAVVVMARRDGAGQGRYDRFVLRDIRRAMERNRAQNEVDQLREYQYFIATHDALTSLPNRQLFEDRAGKVLAQAQREPGVFAIGFIGLDHFKRVNDTHGHAVGDALLRTVGQLLSESVRSTDTVARAGSDEFLLLLAPLRQNAEAEAAVTVQRLREKIAGLRQVEGRDVRISASIGIAFYPAQARTLDSLLICADQAMYAAKRRVGEGPGAGVAGPSPALLPA